MDKHWHFLPAVFVIGLTAFATPTYAQTTDELLNAGRDDNDWILPGKTYQDNRYTGLEQITPKNVQMLAKAWSTEIADNGQQETSPIIWRGTMYLSTPHESVLALDAATGKLKWQFPYNPSYTITYAVNQGVGIADGNIFVATQDCRVIAIDATTGEQSWNVNGCPNDRYASTANSWFHMATYIYKNKIILGTSGGDTGAIGHVMAFSTSDGHRLWDWQSIPGPGQPGHDTWPGDSWQHGGGAVWSGLAIDPETDTLYVAPGNPGPDLVDVHRKGLNLYTNSLVALDISGAKPQMKWYYQLTPDDTHDDDPAMPPVVFDGRVGGAMRHLIAIADKGGNFAILDRTDGKVVYRFPLDNQTGLKTTKPSLKGTLACPNHGGGVEFNGASYDPGTNFFLIPNTEECGIWKITSPNPQYVPGQPFEGGPLPTRRRATGKLTAVDVSTGKIAWIAHFPHAAQGGALVTRSGLAFTSDLGGNLYAVDAKTGKELWKANTGASIIAPISAYNVDGSEYITVVSGSAGSQQTPDVPIATKSVVTAYRLGPIAPPIANSAAGQVAVAESSEANAALPPSTGSAPYTSAQAAAGQTLYEQRCAACHGVQLQGVSGPALTGASFAKAHLNLSQLRSIVTTQMPVTAPGSLKPQQYASIIAYLVSYECVQAAKNGSQPFPAADKPEFAKVILGGRSCPPKPPGQE
jgi:alcohol dehydrogenase (cytochrome c)